MDRNKVPLKTAVVCGAGGFVGTHMVRRLKSEGYWVRGIDLKWPEFSKTEADEFFIADLRVHENCVRLLCKNYLEPFQEREYFDQCIQLAADMGGAGYIFTGEHDADVMHNSAQINLNVCDVLKNTKTKVFYSSSACMYPQELQHGDTSSWGRNIGTYSLKESDAYPANPDSEYGWEKLFSERLYMSFARNYNLDIRIARFHNIYGPEGTFAGGKEKAPAAIARKIAHTNEHCNVGTGRGIGTIDVWGDGEQTRSFLYIDDCIDAVRLLMQSDFKEPINIGSEELVSINELVKITSIVAKKVIRAQHDLTKPQGVRGRNSNNELIEKMLGWKPKYTLKQGIEKLYPWIYQQIHGLQA